MKKTGFTEIKQRKIRMFMREEYKIHFLDIGISRMDIFLKENEVQVIDDVDKSLVVSYLLSGPKGKEKIAIKRYGNPGLKRKIKDIFRDSKAMKEWKIGNLLTERGVLVPLPLALGEERSLRILKSSFLVSRELENSQRLREYLLNFCSPLSEEALRKKRKLIKNLARKLREAHDKGFFHGDLNTSHIMVKIEEEKTCFYFLDFENSEIRKKVSLAKRVKELARLNESMPDFITQADKVRFFKIYSKGYKLFEKKNKENLIKIARRTFEKSKHLTTF